MFSWRNIFISSFICCLLIATVPLRASDNSNLVAAHADRANVVAFLEVTGFDVALDSIAHSAEHAPALLGQEAADFGIQWTHISRDVFDPSTMHTMAIDILTQTITSHHLGHAASFYASDLGQRLVAAENASHGDENTEAKRLRGFEILDSMGPDSDRKDTIQRLIDAVDTSQQSFRAIQEVMVRFLMAASHAGALEYRVDEPTLRALIAKDEEAMLADMKSGGLANAAYTYRDLSNEDLVAYAEVLEHPTMQEVYQLMNAIQFEIMANRFEVLALRMADLQPAEEL